MRWWATCTIWGWGHWGWWTSSSLFTCWCLKLCKYGGMDNLNKAKAWNNVMSNIQLFHLSSVSFFFAEGWWWGRFLASRAHATYHGPRKVARSWILSHPREDGKDGSPICHASRGFPTPINSTRLLRLLLQKCWSARTPGESVAFPQAC